MENPFRAGQDSSEGEEHHVATRHEGIRVAISRFLLIHLDGVVGQRAMGVELTQEGDVEQLEGDVRLGGDLPSDLSL